MGDDAVKSVLKISGWGNDILDDLFGSIICSELHRQGLMDDVTWAADELFGSIMGAQHPYIIKGYRFLAQPIVDLMRVSKKFTKLVNFFAAPWAREMAYEMKARDTGDWAGKIIMKVGMPLCGFVGVLISLPSSLIYGLGLLIALITAMALAWFRRRRTLARV